jgi:hypothetical protein
VKWTGLLGAALAAIAMIAIAVVGIHPDQSSPQVTPPGGSGPCPITGCMWPIGTY